MRTNTVIPVSEQAGYVPAFGMMMALTAGALAAGIVWNSGWSIISFVMPTIACFGAAGIILMHFCNSTNVGIVMTIIMICMFPFGSVITVSGL